MIESVKTEGKVTKAQKRRDKKVDQAREREKMIEEQEKALNILYPFLDLYLCDVIQIA